MVKVFNLTIDERKGIDTEQGYAYGTKAKLGGYRVSATMKLEFPTNDGPARSP